MKLTFWGAAGTVTGSMHLVETGGKRYLLDCGLYQGRRKDADRKNRVLPFPGSSIDAVVLSHAHIDHSGNLPTLVKNGFSGPIYTTPATIDLCNWMLRDTAHIQEKDAEFLNKRRDKRKVAGLENGVVQPLYTTPDAEKTIAGDWRSSARSKTRAMSRWEVKRSRPRLVYLSRIRWTGGGGGAPGGWRDMVLPG